MEAAMLSGKPPMAPKVDAKIVTNNKLNDFSLSQSHSRRPSDAATFNVLLSQQPNPNTRSRKSSESSESGELQMYRLATDSMQLPLESNYNPPVYLASTIKSNNGEPWSRTLPQRQKEQYNNQSTFNDQTILQDIALPTVDSILSNVSRPSKERHRTHDNNGQHTFSVQPGMSYVTNSNENILSSTTSEHQVSSQNVSNSNMNDTEIHSTQQQYSKYKFPSKSPDTTIRNTALPSFADFNATHQRHTILNNAMSNNQLISSKKSPHSMSIGTANSIITSPSLVSALHALQKRCRQLEDQNCQLRDNLAHETRHATESSSKFHDLSFFCV